MNIDVLLADAYLLVNLTRVSAMNHFVSLYDAKTKLSSLVDRAFDGEEIVIAKNGVPHARLVAIASRGQRRVPANAMKIDYLAPDFDAPDPEIEALFNGSIA